MKHMSFKEQIYNVFHNYANFRGRADRNEFWCFALFSSFVLFAFRLVFVVASVYLDNFGFIVFLFVIYFLATITPSLAVLWRRLHDIGKSGANALLYLVPVMNIVMLFWLAKEGDIGPNKYGPDPKNPTAEVETEIE